MGAALRRRKRTRVRPFQASLGLSRRPLVRFFCLFLVLETLAQFALGSDAVWQSFRAAYCSWLARSCGALLAALGADIEVRGSEILELSNGLRVTIARACDAMNAMSILAVGVLAFPVSWRFRAMGLFIGLPILFAANVFRILTLFIFGLFSYQAFRVVHVYVFQTFIIAVTVGLFCAWASSIGPHTDDPREKVRR